MAEKKMAEFIILQSKGLTRARDLLTVPSDNCEEFPCSVSIAGDEPARLEARRHRRHHDLP